MDRKYNAAGEKIDDDILDLDGEENDSCTVRCTSTDEPRKHAKK